jgi:hypothetical protein
LIVEKKSGQTMEKPECQFGILSASAKGQPACDCQFGFWFCELFFQDDGLSIFVLILSV